MYHVDAKHGACAVVPRPDIGVMWVLLYICFGTLSADTILFLVFLALWPTGRRSAFSPSTCGTSLSKISGSVRLSTAIFAFYASATQLIDESLGRVVLPVGHMARSSAGSASSGGG